MSISWKPLKSKSKFLFFWIVSDPQSHNECPHSILSNAVCVIVSTLNLFGVTLLLFSCSVVSNSLQLHRQQHSRLPCPLPSPRVCSNSYPLSWGCHPAISSSVIPFSSCLQSFPAWGLFQCVSSSHQLVKVLELQHQYSTLVLPMNIQDWFPLGLIGLISLQSKGLSKVFSNTTVQKHQFFGAQPSLWFNTHIHTCLLEKPELWLYRDLCWQSNLSAFLFFLVLPVYCYQPISLHPRAHMLSHVTPWTAAHQAPLSMDFSRQEYWSGLPFSSPSLLFNMLSKFVISFLPRSKHILISSLQSPSTILLEPCKIKSLIVSIVSPSICYEVMGPDAMILVSWMLTFKPACLLSYLTIIKRFFSSSLLSAIMVVSSAYPRLLIFLLAVLIPICASSSLVFRIMYSAYELNN